MNAIEVLKGIDVDIVNHRNEGIYVEIKMNEKGCFRGFIIKEDDDWLSIRSKIFRIYDNIKKSKTCDICYKNKNKFDYCVSCGNRCCMTCVLNMVKKHNLNYSCPYCKFKPFNTPCDDFKDNNKKLFKFINYCESIYKAYKGHYINRLDFSNEGLVEPYLNPTKRYIIEDDGIINVYNMVDSLKLNDDKRACLIQIINRTGDDNTIKFLVEGVCNGNIILNVIKMKNEDTDEDTDEDDENNIFIQELEQELEELLMNDETDSVS